LGDAESDLAFTKDEENAADILGLEPWLVFEDLPEIRDSFNFGRTAIGFVPAIDLFGHWWFTQRGTERTGGVETLAQRYERGEIGTATDDPLFVAAAGQLRPVLKLERRSVVFATAFCGNSIPGIEANSPDSLIGLGLKSLKQVSFLLPAGRRRTQRTGRRRTWRPTRSSGNIEARNTGLATLKKVMLTAHQPC
jgi:hypothetical protein